MHKLLYAFTALATLAAGGAHAQNISTRDDAADSGYCREYTQTLTIGGKTQSGYGTACLQPDGSWELQNDTAAAPAAPDAPRSATLPPENLVYVVEDSRVYVTPPEPYVVGTVFIRGERHHFGRDFRPYHHGGGWHGHR